MTNSHFINYTSKLSTFKKVIFESSERLIEKYGDFVRFPPNDANLYIEHEIMGECRYSMESPWVNVSKIKDLMADKDGKLPDLPQNLFDLNWKDIIICDYCGGDKFSVNECLDSAKTCCETCKREYYFLMYVWVSILCR